MPVKLVTQLSSYSLPVAPTDYVIVADAGTGIAYKLLVSDLPAGSTSLADLTDVDIASLTDGNVLVYNSTTTKWENKTTIFGGTF
tara:strand:- start:1220 stop:1474 length:255 start_codon:yes stop_codon:yes gene_type:complete